MSEHLELLCEEREELMKELKDLYDDLRLAGLDTRDTLKLKIKNKEKDLEELENKIRDLKKNEPEDNPAKPGSSKLYIYVITGTNARIKCALAAEEMKKLYLSLDPLNHDDNDRCKWLPFLREKIYIKDLLESLKNDGYKFSVYYLDGYRFADYKKDGYEFAVDEDDLVGRIGEAIEDNIDNTIAIVDLLAIDNENEDLARLFDKPQILRVVTPICRFLPNELQSLMIKKREAVFRILKVKLSKGAFDRFQEASEKMFLKNELSRVIKEKSQFYKRISDTGSDDRHNLKTVSPTF